MRRRTYILYLNDDMYCCPGWDTALVNKLKLLDTDLFMLSGTMIEPRDTNNPCVIVRDYGSDAGNFDEDRLCWRSYRNSASQTGMAQPGHRPW